MLPHQERVVEERLQLDIKIAALVAFSTTEMWKSISHYEQELLSLQLTHMQGYSKILSLRIKTFNN